MLFQGYIIYYNWSQFGCIALVGIGKNVRIMLPNETEHFLSSKSSHLCYISYRFMCSEKQGILWRQARLWSLFSAWCKKSCSSVTTFAKACLALRVLLVTRTLLSLLQ